MNQEPLISVIVPVYKVQEYLNRCVDSILGQTYRNLEIILVDDGSPDDCGAICEEYATKDSRVRVIHKENGGLSSARNAGIDIARGEYLGFVDSDDWIEPEMYETMLALAQKYDVKLVCAGRYDVSSKTGEKTVGLCPAKEEMISGEELVRRIFLWDNIDSAAWDKLYHRSLFREIRYPIGKVCEDVPTTYRIALDAGHAAMCGKPLYNYFHRPGSITTAAISEKTFHFQEHTEKIYADIRARFPKLSKEARYLRVRALAYTVLSVELADAQSGKQFAEKCRVLRRELRKHLWFLVSAPFFGKRERLTDILLALNLYRLLRPVYQKMIRIHNS